MSKYFHLCLFLFSLAFTSSKTFSANGNTLIKYGPKNSITLERSVPGKKHHKTFVLDLSDRKIVDTILAPLSKFYSLKSGKGANWWYFKTHVSLKIEGKFWYVESESLNNFLKAQGQKKLTRREITSFRCLTKPLKSIERKFTRALQTFWNKHRRVLEGFIHKTLGFKNLIERKDRFEKLLPKANKSLKDLEGRRDYYKEKEIYAAHLRTLTEVQESTSSNLEEIKAHIENYRIYLEGILEGGASCLLENDNEDLNHNFLETREENDEFCSFVNTSIEDKREEISRLVSSLENLKPKLNRQIDEVRTNWPATNGEKLKKGAWGLFSTLASCVEFGVNTLLSAQDYQ